MVLEPTTVVELVIAHFANYLHRWIEVQAKFGWVL